MRHLPERATYVLDGPLAGKWVARRGGQKDRFSIRGIYGTYIELICVPWPECSHIKLPVCLLEETLSEGEEFAAEDLPAQIFAFGWNNRQIRLDQRH